MLPPEILTLSYTILMLEIMLIEHKESTVPVCFHSFLHRAMAELDSTENI